MKKSVCFSAVVLALTGLAGCGSNPPKEAAAPAAQPVVAAPPKPVAASRAQPFATAEVTSVAKEEILPPAEPEPTAPEAALPPAAVESTPPPVQTPAFIPPKMQISDSDLKQKLAYGNMLYMSKSATRIAASDNQEAKRLLSDSKQMMGEAKAALEAGDGEKAGKLIDEAMQMFNKASLLVPSESLVAEQKARYESLLKEIDHDKQIYQQNSQKVAKQKGAAAVVAYDVAAVDGLISQAKSQAGAGNYRDAVDGLTKAQGMINAATSKMMDSMTITYELNIDTPEGEWKYEYDRYLGYEELIPVAIEEKKPNEGVMLLVNRSMDKAKQMAQAAIKEANAKSYPKAIAMIQDATEEVRKALRLMGINQ
ncbi:MAG: hypothetical protein AB1810_06295 [Pseudomonadota bacterium]